MVSTAIKTVELLHFSPESQRAAGIFAALARGAGDLTIKQTSSFIGGSDVLLLWGPGAPDRCEPMQRQIERGGHVIACDLAYWDRDKKFRVSLDAPHPQDCVMRRSWSDVRLSSERIARGDAWHADGPVIVAGIGEKARAQYQQSGVHEWERAQIEAAKQAGYRVRYRPKKHGANPFAIETMPSTTPIDYALRGASAVVTWHSNVAVDAIRLGIPVVCRDGAAAAVCESTWRVDLRPLEPSIAHQFLANLAHFQYAPSEARQCWEFITEMLS